MRSIFSSRRRRAGRERTTRSLMSTSQPSTPIALSPPLMLPESKSKTGLSAKLTMGVALGGAGGAVAPGHVGRMIGRNERTSCTMLLRKLRTGPSETLRTAVLSAPPYSTFSASIALARSASRPVEMTPEMRGPRMALERSSSPVKSSPTSPFVRSGRRHAMGVERSEPSLSSRSAAPSTAAIAIAVTSSASSPSSIFTVDVYSPTAAPSTADPGPSVRPSSIETLSSSAPKRVHVEYGRSPLPVVRLSCGSTPQLYGSTTSSVLSVSSPSTRSACSATLRLRSAPALPMSGSARSRRSTLPLPRGKRCARRGSMRSIPCPSPDGSRRGSPPRTSSTAKSTSASTGLVRQSNSVAALLISEGGSGTLSRGMGVASKGGGSLSTTGRSAEETFRSSGSITDVVRARIPGQRRSSSAVVSVASITGFRALRSEIKGLSPVNATSSIVHDDAHAVRFTAVGSGAAPGWIASGDARNASVASKLDFPIAMSTSIDTVSRVSASTYSRSALQSIVMPLAARPTEPISSAAPPSPLAAAPRCDGGGDGGGSITAMPSPSTATPAHVVVLSVTLIPPNDSAIGEGMSTNVRLRSKSSSGPNGPGTVAHPRRSAAKSI